MNLPLRHDLPAVPTSDARPLVDAIIAQALDCRASDIHFEPTHAG